MAVQTTYEVNARVMFRYRGKPQSGLVVGIEGAVHFVRPDDRDLRYPHSKGLRMGIADLTPEPAMPWTLTDFEDRSITLGTRVRMWDYNAEHPEWGQDEKYMGEVIEFGEFDGDVDDEGRSICIYPDVTVLFDNGQRECFGTTEWEFAGWAWEREPESGKVEELMVIA